MSNRMTSQQFQRWMQRTGNTVESVAVETGYTVESVRAFSRGYRDREPPVFWHLICLGIETKREIQRQKRLQDEQR